MVAKDKVALALDVPTVREADLLVARTAGLAGVYKIGLQLLHADGCRGLIRDLAASEAKVFLDAKLLDIDATVRKAVANIVESGADYLTVHAYPQAMRAAAEAAAGSELRLLAVTLLTSMGPDDLPAAGYYGSMGELVRQRIRAAAAAGMHGVVCAAPDIGMFRSYPAGGTLLRVTPGIRPAGFAAGGQTRTATPAEAVRAGSDLLVVGRPVTEAADPAAALREIIAEIDAAEAADD